MKPKTVFQGFCLACALTLFSVCYMGPSFTRAQIQPKYPVSVTIDVKDELTGILIDSLIKRELRDIQDVIVVLPKDAMFEISIRALEMTLAKTQEKTGDIAIATVISVKTGRCYSSPQIGLCITKTKELDEFCQLMIAAFDVGPVEQARQITRDLQN